MNVRKLLSLREQFFREPATGRLLKFTKYTTPYGEVGYWQFENVANPGQVITLFEDNPEHMATLASLTFHSVRYSEVMGLWGRAHGKDLRDRDDFSLMVYHVRDWPEVRMCGLRDLAWVYAKDCSREDAKDFLWKLANIIFDQKWVEDEDE